MPPEDPAFPPGRSSVKREMAKRLWAVLVYQDVSLFLSILAKSKADKVVFAITVAWSELEEQMLRNLSDAL